ncbi:putative ABC transporter ATP-binding protein YdiF [Candidatus Protochlamydia amoebophila]|uniref:ribosomal protection-like ABC-F family protein n=1 Tax=Candidatus Protochlamydia amoebophila TaxID=362787 RepID=UPI001BCA5854|nr:ABC-F family ATP-binding cassette domain-containing protein [Candidatus Protochlamydia amoebophila]MBS4163775.1 putative ABC transporter ATP-binding protein YdiF [Candidatus Protochlamydia amoebophila]
MSRLLIQFSHLFKSFCSFPLFEDLSLSINEGELFALIGENGAGKTTLLQILAGTMQPDSGNFSKVFGISIAFLSQEIVLANPSVSVREFIEGSSLSDLEKEMAACLEDPDRLAEWAELHEKYEQLGGYRRIPIEQVICGLKLESSLLDLPMSRLSSGQRVRAALAKALLENPDLLLLDEPTNHLDQEMLEWLESALKQRQGACIIVSHDRKFLNAVCNRLIEIKNGKLTSYGGSYDFYLTEQERILERQMKAYKAQEEERTFLKEKIKAVTFSKGKPPPPKDRNIIAYYDKRGEKHQKSLQHKLDAMKTRLEEIEADLLPHPKPKSIKGLKFVELPLASSVAIELDHAGKAYGNKVLFSQFCKSICKGDKILVTGPNGCGKMTLLKAIAGIIPLDEGGIRSAPTAKIAFLDQEVKLLPTDQTPLQYFESQFHLSEEDLRRELHKASLEGADLLRRPFCTLSTGQRKRMMLLALVLEKPNVLLLDEPTNHLDFMTLEAFENALLEFEGAIVAVSHDATFIEKIATQEWRLGSGTHPFCAQLD